MEKIATLEHAYYGMKIRLAPKVWVCHYPQRKSGFYPGRGARSAVKTMPKLEWMNTFELRVPEIDGDHRVMLDLMKAVKGAAAERDRERSERYMDRLLAYTESHFAREEVFLEHWKYTDLDKHVKYHAGLIQRAVAVRGACAKVESLEAFKDCCEEMMSFLVDDVVRGDMMLKSFLENAGLTQPV
jgi:hemerythrin